VCYSLFSRRREIKNVQKINRKWKINFEGERENEWTGNLGWNSPKPMSPFYSFYSPV